MKSKRDGLGSVRKKNTTKKGLIQRKERGQTEHIKVTKEMVRKWNRKIERGQRGWKRRREMREMGVCKRFDGIASRRLRCT